MNGEDYWTEITAIDALEEARSQGQLGKPSQIKIKIEVRSGRVSIHIADNGAGIPPSVQSHTFDPFFTTKAVGKGTGLGLSISYQIITEKHKGSLLCCSTPNGTEFIIDIPIHQRWYRSWWQIRLHIFLIGSEKCLPRHILCTRANLGYLCFRVDLWLYVLEIIVFMLIFSTRS